MGIKAIWVWCAVVVAPLAHGQTFGSTTQTLSATFSPIAKLSVPGLVSLVAGATKFSPYTASFIVSYRARTSSSRGGSLTLQVTSDFQPAGGPSVGSGALQFTCAGATLGASCVGLQTANTRSTTVVTLPASACTGGGGACSPADPNTVNLSFTLTNSPTYSTGLYSAQITFTISAT